MTIVQQIINSIEEDIKKTQYMTEKEKLRDIVQKEFDRLYKDLIIMSYIGNKMDNHYVSLYSLPNYDLLPVFKKNMNKEEYELLLAVINKMVSAHKVLLEWAKLISHN